MKKALLSIILILLITITLTGCKKELPKVVNIIQYEVGGEKVVNKKIITDQEIIKKIGDYINDMKPLSESEMVDLVIPREIVITYNDIAINIAKQEKTHCNYANSTKKIDSLAKLPYGLYELVLDILKR